MSIEQARIHRNDFVVFAVDMDKEKAAAIVNKASEKGVEALGNPLKK